MFPFHGNIFSELSFTRKCEKTASFRKCIFLRTYEIFLYDFHFLFKLTKAEVLIYRDVDGDSQTYSYKNVLQAYAANLHEDPCWAFTHKFNAFSFHTPLIMLPHFPLLNCKRILQVEFLNDTLVHM